MVRTIRLEQVASKLALVDGILVWKERPLDSATAAAWNKQCAGKPASLISHKGYPYVRVDNRLYAAHRVVWAVAHGKAPTLEIDHIDGDKTNFSLSNLREVDRKTNARNKGRHCNNTSGVNGVSWAHREHKWRAYIVVDRKRVSLGYHLTKNSAMEARRAANQKYGFSDRHGGPVAC